MGTPAKVELNSQTMPKDLGRPPVVALAEANVLPGGPDADLVIPPYPPRGEPIVFDQPRQEIFLSHVRSTGRVHEACRMAGIRRGHAATLCRADPRFAQMYEDAIGEFREVIETEIHRRAITGVAEPVVSMGQVVAHVTRFSDTMLSMMARRHIPEYKDKQQVDVNVTGGVLVVGAASKDATTWAQEFGEVEVPKAVTVTPSGAEVLGEGAQKDAAGGLPSGGGAAHLKRGG